MNRITTKMNLFGNDEEKSNELDEFMDRYNSLKQGLKTNFTTKDFDILINAINKLKEKNSKNEDVIYRLYNENNELKNELNKYKIEYQKLYSFKEKYKNELENLKSKAFIPKKKIQQITEQQILEIKKLRSEGSSYSEIERQTKWSKYTISRVLNGHYDTK